MTEERFSNTHVLLVEDDRTHRDFIAQILENIGCKVIIAFNGSDALSFIKRHRYDVILMDVEMPEMDGIEAARAIREMKRRGDIADEVPIIAITANHDPETERACIDAGMVGLIPKHVWKPKWEPSIREKMLQWLPATTS